MPFPCSGFNILFSLMCAFAKAPSSKWKTAQSLYQALCSVVCTSTSPLSVKKMRVDFHNSCYVPWTRSCLLLYRGRTWDFSFLNTQHVHAEHNQLSYSKAKGCLRLCVTNSSFQVEKCSNCLSKSSVTICFKSLWKKEFRKLRRPISLNKKRFVKVIDISADNGNLIFFENL